MSIESTWMRINWACVQQCCTASVILYVWLHAGEGYCSNRTATEPRGRQDADSAAATPVFQTVDVKRIRAAWMRLISLVSDAANNLPLLVLSFSDVFVSRNSSPLFFADTRRRDAFALSVFTFAFPFVYLTPTKMMKVTRGWWFFWKSENDILGIWQQEHNVSFLFYMNIFYNRYFYTIVFSPLIEFWNTDFIISY